VPFFEIAEGSVRVPSWDAAGYRLATEAEWEFACRARSPYSSKVGDSDEVVEEYTWFNDNSGGVTHPVGEKKPNRFGLFDMHGNVWEWCFDVFSSDRWKRHYYEDSPINDPRGPDRPWGWPRTLRGGGGASGTWECGSTRRLGLAVQGHPPYDPFLGFRVARNAPSRRAG
jgi:formylglycine-generating enzyme required for sulfatase activity